MQTNQPLSTRKGYKKTSDPRHSGSTHVALSFTYSSVQYSHCPESQWGGNHIASRYDHADGRTNILMGNPPAWQGITFRKTTLSCINQNRNFEKTARHGKRHSGVQTRQAVRGIYSQQRLFRPWYRASSGEGRHFENEKKRDTKREMML